MLLIKDIHVLITNSSCLYWYVQLFQILNSNFHYWNLWLAYWDVMGGVYNAFIIVKCIFSQWKSYVMFLFIMDLMSNVLYVIVIIVKLIAQKCKFFIYVSLAKKYENVHLSAFNFYKWCYQMLFVVLCSIHIEYFGAINMHFNTLIFWSTC